MRREIVWTPEMLAALRSLRAQGYPLYLCAERIGVTYANAVYKARDLGIQHRMNRGNKPAWKEVSLDHQ